jgi:hypothetical protein
MFCPQCGSTQNDDLKFCKSCGTNLEAVRSVTTMRRPDEKFDWSRTWVAEMFLSESERKRRKEEIDRERGITPAMKRYTEIKTGVIVSSVGLAVMIFLNALMQGIILSGHTSPDNAEIISRIWLAGIIPFFVGLALVINGWFVSKKQVELAQRELIADAAGKAADETSMLRSADTAEFKAPRFGITEGTTKHLGSPTEKP